MLLRAGMTAVVVLAATLVGCSSSVTGKPSAAQTGSESPSAADAATAPDTSDIVPSGMAKITVAGTVLQLTGPVTCLRGSGHLSVGRGGASVDLDSLTLLNVKSVYILAEGFQLGLHGDQLAGQATATRTGDTFRIQGVGTGMHNNVPNRAMKFTIVLTCPPKGPGS